MNDVLAAGLVGASLLRIVNLGAKNTATQEPIDRRTLTYSRLFLEDITDKPIYF